MASNPQSEPTMEEILASIRKIIAEDSNETLPEKSNGGTTVADQDVFELREADVVQEPQHENAHAPESPHAARFVPESPVVVPTREESPVSEASSAAETRPSTSDGFFSDSTRKAMHDTFSRLEPVAEEGPQASQTEATFAPNGASVQEVFEHAVRETFGAVANDFLHGHVDEVVERMKPLVREWMDEHFPAILEGAVRNEVERAVRAAAVNKRAANGRS
jgi:cell pole-organizing protein PopZ